MKILKYSIVLIVILSAAAWFLGKFYGKSDASRQEFKLAKVSRGDLQAIVTSTGRLSPLNTVKVGTQVSGNIKDLFVDFNHLVKKDQVIALIDPAIYAAQVEQAKAELLMARMQLQERRKDIEAAKANVTSAKAQLVSSKASFRDAELRYIRLAKLGDTVSKSDLDSAQARRDNDKGAMDASEAKILTAEAQLRRIIAQEKGVEAMILERQAALDLAEIKLQYCTIKSPINGVVISRDVDVGQTVAATLQSPVLFTIAEDLTRMQVEVDVSEADVGQIQAGQVVTFTVDAFQEKKFKAKVREVRNVATNIQNVVTYKIIADVNNDALLLRPGMTANVNIMVASVKDVLMVPNGALRFKPPGEAGEARSDKSVPIKERSFYRDTVKKVGLDATQSGELVRIIEKAGKNLKAVYALPEEERDLKQAWQSFFTHVFTSLHKVLREDQREKLSAYVAELKEARKKRGLFKGRPAKVYVPGENGRPGVVNITAGVTNEDQTQVLAGDLNEGDTVITGLLFNAGGKAKENQSFLTTLFKGR